MIGEAEATARRPSVWRRLRDLLFRQHTGTARLSVAVGVGVFIGLTPLYGLHAILGIAIAWVLRLNAAVTVLATQIANPLFAPLLIGTSAWLGSFMGAPSGVDVADAGVWYDPSRGSFYASWFRGGLVLGLGLGALAGLITYGILSGVRRRRDA